MLKRLNRLHYLILVYLGALLAVNFIDSNYILDIIFMTVFWAALAGAWNISGGYAGQFSLGHAAFVGIGAYTVGLLYLHFHISPWLGMIAGAVISVILAMFIGVLSFKSRGPFYTLITIAFAQLIHISAVQLKGLTRGSEGLSIPFKAGFANMMFSDRAIYVMLALTLLVLLYVISTVIEHSKFGYYLVALRENENAALALGIPVKGVKIAATTLSAFFTSICGSFYTMYILFLEPNSVLSFTFSIQPALISIIGGLGTAFGPIVGSVLLTPMEMLLRANFNHINGLNLVIYGTLLVVVVLFWPEGIVVNIKKLFKKKKAKDERGGGRIAA